MFKKRKRPTLLRSKKDDDNTNNGEEEEIVLKKGSKRVKKSIVEYSNKGAPSTTMETPTSFSFSSSGTALPSGSHDQLATAISITEEQQEQLLLAQEGTTEKPREGEEDPTQTSSDGKIYMGQSKYTQYHQNKSRWAGPIRAPLHIRNTCRFDYQPDICKDWKETGYCGYGESCKFLHDRSDYKTGWQLERDWDSQQRVKRQGKTEEDNEYFVGSEDENENEYEDGLPFACFICKQPYGNPVVTLCEHYFCEKCASEHFKKDSKCFVCKKQTKGIFNVASNIIKKQKEMAKKKIEETAENENEEDNKENGN